MRLFHLRVKLRTPIPHVRDGVRVIGNPSLPLHQSSDLAGPPTPGQPTHTIGRSNCASKFGSWDARRLTMRPTRANSLSAWRWFLKSSVSLSLLQRRLPPHPTARVHQRR
ncbi:hypothetical protein TcCL_ESM02791 [Trypanosoma cruzi]|nr:hypothetical protein TcCL_ESM02791 [Trypanosoma cruzi]